MELSRGDPKFDERLPAYTLSRSIRIGSGPRRAYPVNEPTNLCNQF